MKTEGKVEINSYGIATCHENCSFYFHQEKSSLLNSAFSFLFLQISPHANIKFGISDDQNFPISFDYFNFLSNLRNEKISPQIQIDGLGVLFHLYINKNGKFLIYVNDVLCYSSQAQLIRESSFYLEITNKTSESTIVATSIDYSRVIEADNDPEFPKKIKNIYDKLELADFNRFFPSYEPDFWVSDQDHICVSDFYIGSISKGDQSCQIISQKPLLLLPCIETLYYFEIIVRNYFALDSLIDFTVGLITPALFDQKGPQNIGILQPRSIIYYNCKNDVIKTHTQDSYFPSVRSKLSKTPATIGFGVGYGELYFTFNGEILYKTEYNPSDYLDEKGDLVVYPFYLIPSQSIGIEFNFGQLPFKYEGDMLVMAPGWATWYPKHDTMFKIGMTPHQHLLNTFLSFGRPSDIAIQLQCKDEFTSDEVKYEIHLLHLEKPDLIGCGFSNKDFKPGQMVGWDPKCVGLHSDDGKLFYQTGIGTSNIVPEYFIRTGTTETVYLNGQSLSYFIDREKKENVCTFPHERYPTITTKGGTQFVINFGESPFYAFEKDYEGPDSVSLFNKLKVKMSNELVSLFQLNVGDVIESRDRSFRGTVAGSLKDRLYAYIPTFSGAFPLVENTFFDFCLNYRIVYRKETLFQRIITNKKEPVIIDVSQSLFDKIYPTQFGLSFFIGQISIENKQHYIFRPVEDLFNNSSTVILNEMPREIISQNKTRVYPLFYGIGHEGQNYMNDIDIDSDDDEDDDVSVKKKDALAFQLFDIVQYSRRRKKDSQKIFIVVGSDDENVNNVLCFDGSQFLRIEASSLKSKKIIINFLLNPFGFRRERQRIGNLSRFIAMNVGMMRGGRYFPINYRGSYGSTLECISKNRILFPSNGGGCCLPPLLDFYLKRLNSIFASYMIKDGGDNVDVSIVNRSNLVNNNEIDDSWVYTTDVNQFQNNLKLVTKEDFCGKIIIVDH